MSKTYYGFGYAPSESENHFYVIIPKRSEERRVGKV